MPYTPGGRLGGERFGVPAQLGLEALRPTVGDAVGQTTLNWGSCSVHLEAASAVYVLEFPAHSRTPAPAREHAFPAEGTS